MASLEKSRYLIPMLERSMRVLELLSEAEEGLSLAELCQRLAAPKSSVFNILATLEEAGYLRAVNTTGKYTLTAKLFHIGSPAIQRLDPKRTLYPYLVELVELTGETANLGILDGREALYIESVPGSSRVRVAVTPGERLDLHCTALGKTLLAFLDTVQADELLAGRPLPRRTPNTITDRASLTAQLALIRERGYAIDDEEDNLDIRCIGAPIRDYTGRVTAAVSITAPKHRLSDTLITEKAGLVMAMAARMSQALGYDER